MRTVESNKKYTVKVFPEDKIVTHQMHGFVEGDDFKAMFRAGRDAYIKHNCTAWLSDDSLNPMVNQEDLIWAQAEWEPQILEAGWKYWALVVPEKIFGKMAMRAIIQRYKEKGVTVEVFKSYEDGLAWLKAQNQS
ncbi:MAG: hypothetical protein JXR76_07245 [Deltaproteobacteria bacterium]|nr:hypothetical protein [Deltaproteobacteria bacterium]